eukprot:g4496.t1
MADVAGACAALGRVRKAGGGLLILSGAGMSVSSGVPVFRGADGTMSPDFLRFLGRFNAARARAGLPEVDDWFSFSVPEMFRAETAAEAWAYWRWRILRALVTPADDYVQLGRLVEWFGEDRVFVQTSNCDGLHVRRAGRATRTRGAGGSGPEPGGGGGVGEHAVCEVHGSLSRVQCSGYAPGPGGDAGEPCSDALWPVDDRFLARLREEPSWVPLCPACRRCCLRPNVMIFDDWALVDSVLVAQRRRLTAFLDRFTTRAGGAVAGPGVAAGAVARDRHNWAVLEVGAGVVIPSIRMYAEELGNQGDGGLIRVNPSKRECESMHVHRLDGKYWPLVARSSDALATLMSEIGRGWPQENTQED